MLAIFQFMVFFLLWPYVLFGIVLGLIFKAICTVFQPVLLLVAVWVASLGCLFLPYMEPNNNDFSSLVEVIAQSHLLGMPTPFAIFAIAGCIVIASVIARQRKPLDW